MGERIRSSQEKPGARENYRTSSQNKTESQSYQSPVDRILNLQKTIGNQAVTRMIQAGVIQASLKIGQPGDIYEKEADRVANQIMRMRTPETECPECEEQVEGVQRQEEEEEQISPKAAGNSTAVSSDIESRIQSMKGGGQPLSESTRAFFEPRFRTDFSQVRVHTGSVAAETAQAINARAFTTGKDIVFGAGQYSPGTSGGKRLLAHELTHTMQQGSVTQRKNDTRRKVGNTRLIKDIQRLENLVSLSPQIQLYQDEICGRPSTQFSDFPETYISSIDVDLTSPDHSVTLTWTGPNASRGETGPFHSSPGAGLCDKDCDNDAESQEDDSLCTPKGTRKVENYRCVMSGHPTATNVTYFHWDRRIAFHYFPSVPNYPASHGCVRLGSRAAQLIYDNSRIGLTSVTVGGTWSGTRCYNDSDSLVPR